MRNRRHTLLWMKDLIEHMAQCHDQLQWTSDRDTESFLAESLARRPGPMPETLRTAPHQSGPYRRFAPVRHDLADPGRLRQSGRKERGSAQWHRGENWGKFSADGIVQDCRNHMLVATIIPVLRARIPVMNASEPTTIARFFVDSLEVFVFENRALAGQRRRARRGAGDREPATGRRASQHRLRGRPEPERIPGRPGRHQRSTGRTSSPSTWTNTWGSAPTIRSRFAAISRNTCSGWSA